MGKKGPVPKKSTIKSSRNEVDRRGAQYKESEIQKQCEDLLIAKQIKFIRIPDALYGLIFSKYAQYIPAYIKKLISAFIKGVPDLTLLFRSGKYVCVELKTATGRMPQGQKNFRRAVGEDNYKVVRSVEGLVELLEEYGE